MNIAYHCTDNYAQITATSIISVFESNKDFDEINVYIIENAFRQETKKKLLELAERYGRKIFFIPLPDINKEYELGLVKIKKNWAFDSYSRMFLDRLLPNDVERILYLDGDILNVSSLNELWNIDLDGKCCAAAMDCVSNPYYSLFGLDDDSRYCNSGVIVIDLNAWRKHEIGKKVRAYVQKNNGYVFFMEQTVFNVVLQGSIKYLEANYNVSSLMQAFSFEELKRMRRYKYFYSKKEVDEALKHPVIIHMTGLFYITNRAWSEVTNHPSKDLFTVFAKKLNWSKEIHQPDNRDLKTKGCDFFIHAIPKPVLIVIVSWLYNRVRVKRIINQGNRARAGSI